MMQEWLQARGQPLPDEHAHHVHGAKLMPGMLTAGGDGASGGGQRARSSIDCFSNA